MDGLSTAGQKQLQNVAFSRVTEVRAGGLDGIAMQCVSGGCFGQWHMTMKPVFVFLMAVLLEQTLAAPLCMAQLPGDSREDAASREMDIVRRKTAVTLNYCRAALHRIRRTGTKQVLYEEQQRILNNIDLNQIDDPEVIALYRSILDEIGMVEISDRERTVITEGFRRGVQRKMGTDLFVMGAQAATGQVGSVIQTGASSWWDYRNNQLRRDSDLWQVEKTQFQSLMTRSSSFLDSFWKLSRKNNIPDRWLLRDQDLDQLTEAMAIEKTDVRLRSLKRLERFMECYPPYWYYLARTQQQLGDADSAAETFRRLTEIGRGHFRQDDMLASSMANLSLIQESRRDPEAPETAQLAFEYSTRNWEANLVCAWILGRHRRYTAAEELILCNVDEQLETEQSSVALASLYYHSGDRQRLSALLDERETVQRIPIPALLLCAKLLGSEHLPAAASEQLASTLTAVPRIVGRTSSISVAAAPGWKLADAEASISDGARTFEYSGHRDLEDRVEVSFSPSLNSPAVGDPGNSLKLVLHYPQTPEVLVLLREDSRPAERAAPRNRNSGLLPAFVPTLQRQANPPDREVRVYRISEIEVAGTRLSLQPGAAASEQIRAEQAEISGLDDDTRPRLREIR